MKKFLSLCLLIILSSSSMFALDMDENKAINQIIEHFTNVWNDHEGQGTGNYYEQDADFVNIFGMAFAGKQEIEARHVQIHESFLKGSVFEVTGLKIREAKPGVVIAHVYWKVSNIQKDPHTMKGIFTHVILKNHDKWEITATQNTSILN